MVYNVVEKYVILFICNVIVEGYVDGMMCIGVVFVFWFVVIESISVREEVVWVVFVEGDSYDMICGKESFFNIVFVMDIDVDIEDVRICF